MARRRSMYGKKRKINYGRVMLLLLILAAIIALIFSFFKKDEYIGVIDKVLKAETREISGTVSSVSGVDTAVYSNNGIRYTNQHENIKKLNSFDSAKAEDAENAGKVKRLFEILLKAKKSALTKDLPLKEDGYYWIDADFVIKSKKLIFSDEDEYNFDLYYDKDTKTAYIKEAYFSEFSKKNNKQKLQGYEATEEFTKLIEELAGNK